MAGTAPIQQGQHVENAQHNRCHTQRNRLLPSPKRKQGEAHDAIGQMIQPKAIDRETMAKITPQCRSPSKPAEATIPTIAAGQASANATLMVAA